MKCSVIEVTHPPHQHHHPGGHNERYLSDSGRRVLTIPDLRFRHNNTRTLAGLELVSKDQSIFRGL